jgi:hypothetical protein
MTLWCNNFFTKSKSTLAQAVAMEFWRKNNFGIKCANLDLLKRERAGTLGKTLKEAENDGCTQA